MTGWYVLTAVLLLLANGFFVGAEFALIAARRSKIEKLAAEGDARARTALASIKEISFMLAGTQLGITMASLGLGFVAEPGVARLLQSALGSLDLSENVIHSISVVVALTIVVFLHMVIGEMAPKNMAIAAPEKTALWLAYPYRLYANLFRPFIRLLNAVAAGGLRLLGVQITEEIRPAHSVEEIGMMIAESARGGLLDRFEYRLLSGAVEFGERDAASAMVPRTEMVAVQATITPEEIEALVLETGHSRFPVYVDNLDNIVGFFHAKDLLRISPDQRGKPLAPRLIRQMLVVPESRKLHPLLVDMRRQRIHFALVVDEHGGTAGVVTIEDLLEELVGEIRDEHDIAELGIQRLGDQRWLVPGTLRIDEVTDRLGIELPEGDYETVAGFLMDKLGRVPKRRDFVDFNGRRLSVRSMHRRRVVQVLIEPVPDRHV